MLFLVSIHYCLMALQWQSSATSQKVLVPASIRLITDSRTDSTDQLLRDRVTLGTVEGAQRSKKAQSVGK